MDAITGAFLIGTWASSTLVWVAFLIDTVGLLDDYVCVYLYTITHAGGPELSIVPRPAALILFIRLQVTQHLFHVVLHWQSIPVCTFTTAAVAIVVQTFLVIRYWKFAPKHVIALFLCLLILAGFGGSFTCGMMVALFPAFKDRFKLKIPVVLWLVTEAVADLGITAALLWEFLRTRSTSTETRNVLNGLVTVTLRTGTATAAVAVAALVGYYLNQESNTLKPQHTEIGACMEPIDIESGYLDDTQYKRGLRTARDGDGYES
ncbi:hypothetical protein MVEN_01876900 [Mycena venus]|uniref:Uncharacterized protein n=1 Tax=Mycena venus TaxID=2733690 RepID=A0A8H6XJ08_9AGAR|nr:hypothetical protein MVEN_01876900 [Mycena venus]